MILSKKRKRNVDYTWPGFVDALSSLLMVIIFVLMIFVLSQFFLSQKMSGQDDALVELKSNLIELSNLLSIERDATTELTSQLSLLETKIIELRTDLDEEKKITSKYIQEISGKDNIISLNQSEIINLKSTLDKANQDYLTVKKNMSLLTKENDLKNNQIKDKETIIRASQEEIRDLISASLKLRNKLSQLQTLLSAYKAKDKKEKVKTVSLGKDVNSALARRVEELQKFKSDFFGRVRALIKGRKEIRIVGDRFVFQSEVLFTLGSDELGEKGQLEMIKLASTLTEIEKSLPTDIDWILQIDGHTDNLPVKQGQSFRDNWELSTKRALSVLRFLIKQGIKPSRLSASGYGSFQPIDKRNLVAARMKNRRIEMKITQSTKLK
ncbi:peptidoglycan -binding protein [Alphaproteobacteria bacterium]|nr:peptidoglycan -binding protein [Alphaproteobacteria bacterium]